MNTSLNRVKQYLTATGAFTMLLISQAAHSDYVPPMGIPSPPFGIDNVAPSIPQDWSSNTTGFYYVSSGGGNSGNGYPGNPRATIPDPLPAGSVVVVEGEYTTKHETNKLTANGTDAAPVYIRGISDTNHGVFKQKVVIEGSYYIVEYMDGRWDNSSYNGKLHLSGEHGVARNGDFRGDTNGCVGGVHVDSGATHMVIYNNKIHHGGDVSADYDQDCHGTVVPRNVSNLWILENEYSYNSGDGVQINAGSAGNDATHHIYLGKNVSHHNKQAGLWTKQARDVIFSENEVYGHVASGSSMGEGMGLQYGPDYVWFIFNHIHDNESGIRLASDSGGTGTEHFVIGNEIYNIHKPNYDAQNSWEVASVAVWGSTNTHIVGNTFWNVDAGVNSPRARGKIDIINNIFDAPSVSEANQIYFYEDLIANSMVDNNVFKRPVKMKMGSSTQIDLEKLQNTYGQGSHSFAVGDMTFINTAKGSFIPAATSAAANSGTTSTNVYQTFFNRYGIDIEKDITGAPRVMDSNPEIGAYEITGEVGNTVSPPSPPILSID